MEPAPRTETPTLRRHRRQFAWQILVPMIVAAVLVILAAVFTLTRGATSNRVWADISTIWLIAPLVILALVLTVVLGALIYGAARLLGVIPAATGRVQSFMASVAKGTRKAADDLAKPFLWSGQAGAVFKSIFKR